LKYKSYREIDKIVDELFAEQKYEEAIELLGNAQEQFPNDLYEILWYEAIIYVVLGDHENCLDSLENMISKGFFGELEWNFFDPIRNDIRFKVVSEESQRLKAEAQKIARMEYQVYTPKGYSSKQQYPLFIALHGDGHSLEYFKSNWEATGLLNKGFILVYIQSSQVICTNGFGWTPNYEITRQDIKAAYDEAVGQYSIDTDNILIGGFSGGAIAAIEITMDNTLPVKGFISLCPSRRPASFSKENVERAVQRGARGVLMEGEKEGEVPAEQEMIGVFNEANFPYQFHINSNTGHASPQDFWQKLLNAIAFIMD
jgi:predicted esterase